MVESVIHINNLASKRNINYHSFYFSISKTKLKYSTDDPNGEQATAFGVSCIISKITGDIIFGSIRCKIKDGGGEPKVITASACNLMPEKIVNSILAQVRAYVKDNLKGLFDLQPAKLKINLD